MRTQVIALFLSALLGFTGAAAAVIGTADDVPAATLLLPYFEVDGDNPNNITTIVTVRNADSAPVVAHFTFWTNLSVPVLTFDVYLTGFDQQAINLRDVLVSGILPRTGPADFVSPRGPRSGPHSTFGNTCSAFSGPPAYTSPIPASTLTQVQASLTGGFSQVYGGCVGMPTENLVGYITIDAVNQCTLLFPSSPGYFAAGGHGVASNRNVLWGDWMLIDPGSNFAHSDTFVHIEASADHPLTGNLDSHTFYGRFTGGLASDNREAPSRAVERAARSLDRSHGRRARRAPGLAR